MPSNYIFTSESVSEGHPDKICDQISDAILDAYLARDAASRIACEVMVSADVIFIVGEIKSREHISTEELELLIRNLLVQIGYDKDYLGFDAKSVEINIRLGEQSPDISQGVEGMGLHQGQGAGDQGIMFGFAVNETPEFMPLTTTLSHDLLRQLSFLRKNEVDFLLPDAKSQVSIEYENHKPKSVHTIVLSTQHIADIEHKDLKEFIIENIIKKIVPTRYLQNTRYLINPTGKFLIGGPKGDAGLTGRKIIVDTYGGWSRHGGGAFSGKDPSKVDRSATYMCRYCAKNIVAAGLADKCELQISYAIGYAQPVSLFLETFGTNKIPVEDIEKKIKQHFSFVPEELISELELLDTQSRKYLDTAVYGHFGRDLKQDRNAKTFSWEKLDKIELLSPKPVRAAGTHVVT